MAPNKYFSRLALLLLCFWATAACPSSAETVLIMNQDLADEALSNNDLLRVFAMKKRTWSNGKSIRVYTLPNKSSVHRDFVYTYLKMQPHHLSRLWHKLVFSGTGSKPEVVNTSKEMLDEVARTPGAIGYLDSEHVDTIDDQVIKVPYHD